MIRGKFLTSQDDTRAVMDIRRRVFVEEQGFSPDTEIDEFDKLAVYALAYDENDRPAARAASLSTARAAFRLAACAFCARRAGRAGRPGGAHAPVPGSGTGRGRGLPQRATSCGGLLCPLRFQALRRGV